MKKYIIVLFTVLTACSIIRKPDKLVAKDPINADKVLVTRNILTADNQCNKKSNLENQDTFLSSYQIKDYLALISFKGDTLGYLNYNFIDNPHKYKGKELNTLLKDCEIPIKSYMVSQTGEDNTTQHIYLQFYTFDQVSTAIVKRTNPVNLIIEWIVPLPKDSAINLLRKSKGTWTENEVKYYGKQIIGKISTTKWNK